VRFGSALLDDRPGLDRLRSRLSGALDLYAIG
jgi:hypothetical protein